MDKTEFIQMTLNIGGCRIPVNVPFSQQEFVREVEMQVNDLYTAWRHKFSKRSDREVMAMVAYQFANFYSELTRRNELAADRVRKCAEILDGMEQTAENGPENKDLK